MSAVESIIHGLLIAIDDAGATLLFGSNDLTISSRVGMALSDHECGTYAADGPHGLPEWAMLALARGLNALQRAHCMERPRKIVAVVCNRSATYSTRYSS